MVDRRDLALLDRQPHRAWLWALALGLLSASGFQPLGLWPLALLAAGAFALLIARTSGMRQAAWLGWLFGVAHFTLGNNWIAAAFTHQSEMPAFVGWIAVPGIALVLAIFPALAAWAARGLVRTGPGWPFALVFAGAWIIGEWLRSWMLTGYAWNPFSVILLGPLDRPGLVALSPLMGTYALSGAAMLAAAALALLARERRWRIAALVSVMLVAGMYWPVSPSPDSALRVTVVQPNLEQARLDQPALYEANFMMLAGLSADRAKRGPRIVLWPESGMADYLREGYPQRYYDRTTAFADPLRARRRLGAVVGEESVLLTGAVDLEIAITDGYARAVGARNAVTVVGPDGALLASYYKAHLVPGGEYLPFREWLEPLGLTRLVAGTIDFLPGPGPRTLDLGAHGKAGVQVCYEIIFSGRVTDRANRPDYIFTDSNDGWFGAFGPPQFLAQTRMRAVEEGLPILRSTTTGISAVIDPRGVVRHHLATHVPGRIDTMVPLAASPTIFSRFGNALSLIWAALFIFGGVFAMRRGRPRPIA